MSSRDWVEKDFYAALGVPKTASAADIKKAYRQLARELHPDRNPGDAKAEERFKSVSEAYDVLSDDRRRSEYDEMRSLFASGSFRRGAAPPFDFSDMFAGTGTAQPGGRFGGGFQGPGGLGDLFSTMFSGGQAGQGRRAGLRGRDIETEVVLGFAESIHGVTLPLTLKAPGACEACGGTGAKSGTKPRTCSSCRGTGLVTTNQGAFSFSEPCRDCQGVGTVVDEKCRDCRGTGVVTKNRTINVRIPPGVDDGQRIRLAGRGEPGERGGAAGDLNILVKVRKDDLFDRSGLDLTIALPVSYSEAVFGCVVRVPTVDGAVSVRVPAGTPSGRILRVRDRGVHRTDGRTGDLLVTIEVHIPTEMSAAARATLEDFAEVCPPAPRSKLDAVARDRDGGSAGSQPEAGTPKRRRGRDGR